jgi:hypothetical protein
METLGIKTTIYDFFSYFIPGVICNNCIILAIYFSGYTFFIPFSEIFGKETLASLPNWFLILTLILVTYIFGIIISNISSLLIEKIIVRNIHFLNNFVSIDTNLSENTFRGYLMIKLSKNLALFSLKKILG